MKFIADVMLGRLAKRMRLLGYDVLYDRTLDDNEIIRLSLEQNRVILTRDKALTERPLAANHLFVESARITDQLEQVLGVISSTALPAPFSRCSLCNELLLPIAKQNARDRIPRYVYEKKDTFLRCPQCERLYWKGTHVRRMTVPHKIPSK